MFPALNKKRLHAQACTEVNVHVHECMCMHLCVCVCLCVRVLPITERASGGGGFLHSTVTVRFLHRCAQDKLPISHTCSPSRCRQTSGPRANGATLEVRVNTLIQHTQRLPDCFPSKHESSNNTELSSRCRANRKMVW